MKKLTYKSLLLLIIIFSLGLNNIAYAENVKIPAKAGILIDGKTGQVIFEQNAHQKLYPASTTKVMTAILAIEKGNMDQMMTASSAAVKEIGFNGSNAGLASGEILSLDTLLHALLLKSANDSANIIAENISPTRKDFIDLMNQKALDLGATETTFTNTCGLDKADGHPNHFTSVADMSKIAKYAMSLPKFREVVSLKTYIMPETNKHPASFWPKEYITTTNRLMLNYNTYKSNLYTPTGIKTGYTNAAGCNLVASGIGPDHMELITVIFGANDQDSLYKEAKKLLEYGFSTYAISTIVNQGDKVISVEVENAKNENSTLDLVYNSPLSLPMPKDTAEWQIEKKVFHDQSIQAPIKQGDKLGFVEFYRSGQKIGAIDLVASQTISAAIPKNNMVPNNTALPKTASNYFGILFDVFVIMMGLYLFLFLLRLVLRRASRLVKAKRAQN